MKVTAQDIEMANRFPAKCSLYGFGMSQSDAKLSHQQLQRLLKLELIQPDERSQSHGGYAGADGKKNLGAGIMGRHCTGFVRVDPPKAK